ncbi:MAG: arginase family protein [Gaiellales bacterium]
MTGTVIDVPWCSRFHGAGMEEGPAAVAAALGITGSDVVELSLEEPPLEALVAGLPRLHDAVAAADGVPLALLGECTLAPAVTAGLRRLHPDLVLVWVDAHGDLNTPATSPSGFLGGMPFAILLGWCHEPLRRAAGAEPPLPEDRAALVGARDLDPGERDSISRSRLVVADDIAGALRALPAGTPVHLHLDGDVLDPDAAPGVDFPAPGGWSGERLDAEMAALAESSRVVGVSVCCGNPRRDPDGRGARAYARALQPLWS